MTNNLHGRLERHNAGEVRATRGFQWEMLAYATVRSRIEAATLEQWLKTGDSRAKRDMFIRYCPVSLTERSEASSYLLRKAQLWKAQRDIRRTFLAKQPTTT